MLFRSLYASVWRGCLPDDEASASAHGYSRTSRHVVASSPLPPPSPTIAASAVVLPTKSDQYPGAERAKRAQSYARGFDGCSGCGGGGGSGIFRANPSTSTSLFFPLKMCIVTLLQHNSAITATERGSR